MALLEKIFSSLRKKRKLDLDMISMDEILRSQAQVRSQLSRAERQAEIAERELDRAVERAIEAEGSLVRKKKALREAQGWKLRIKTYNNLADRVSVLNGFLDKIKLTKELKAPAIELEELLSSLPGIEGIIAAVSNEQARIIGTTDIFKTLEESVAPVFETEVEDHDLEDLLKQVEKREEELFDTGDVETSRQELKAELKARIMETP